MKGADVLCAYVLLGVVFVAVDWYIGRRGRGGSFLTCGACIVYLLGFAAVLGWYLAAIYFGWPPRRH